MLLGFPEYAAQAAALAAAAGMQCRIVDVHHFPDGESRLTLPPKIPAAVTICRSLDRPNDKLVELVLAAATARDLGAARVTLVAPYLCYMRQDMAFAPGEAVSQRIVGRLLAERFDRVVTVDPHLHRVLDLRVAIPGGDPVALSAAPVIARFLKSRLAAPLLLGPDRESRPWVEAIAGAAGFECAVAAKTRTGDREVTVALPGIAPDGREMVLVDDVASTGCTLARTAEQCLQRGAARVHVVVTHGLFVGDAIDRLRSAGVDRIWSTDSVPHETNAIPLAGLLASALGPGDRSQPGGDDEDPRMPGTSAGEAVRRRGNW
jgi:ribose-phosphate pyrophosphokinase